VKTNGLTDIIFSSAIFTDENNSISKSVEIYQQRTSVGDTVGIYLQTYSVDIYRSYCRRTIQFFWKVVTMWWRGFFFQTILLTEWPRDSNQDIHTVTWHFHRWNHRRVYRRKCSVNDSIGKSHYFSFFFLIPPLPSQTVANHPSQLSPLLNISTQVSYTFVRGHNIRSCGFCHFL